MERLRSYLWRHWKRYLLGSFCLLGTATLVMWIPWWIREAVSIIERGGPMEGITPYVLAIILAAIAQGIIRTFSRTLIFNAGRDVEYELRNDLFAHLQTLPPAFYQSQKTGDLMSRLINDISAVRLLLGPGVLNLLNAPLYYLYALILMLSMDVRMTLAALLPCPLLIWLFGRFREKILTSSLKVQQQMSELSSHIQENLSGMHVVKAYAQEENQTRQFARLNQDYQEKNIELAKLRGLLNPFMQGLSGLTVLMVLAYGGSRVIAGDLMIADIVAFIAYVNILAWPTAAFGWMFSLIERGRAAMGRLEELFRIEPQIVDPPEPASANWEESIKFRHVWFAYQPEANGQAALKDVSFTLPRGRALAVVGPTGAGKTTLAQLLPRLYEVTQGQVQFGGTDIRSLSLPELRRGLGYVPQDPFLFSDSLRRNLTYGRDDASDEEIEKVVRLTRLDRDLETFPQGLDTIVGERGVTLSGGQKQRATLARTLLLDPPVLIFDDCLSSVDAQTEHEILKALKPIMKQKTCLIVSHRISAVQDADEILVLDEGKIVERGSHQELLRRGGPYAEICRLQQLSEEIENI